MFALTLHRILDDYFDIFTVPLRDLYGDQFCFWVKMPSCIYLTGSNIWSCHMALFRLLVRYWVISRVKKLTY